MSVDMLHEKIRKTKNPTVLDLGMKQECIPPKILEGSQTLPEAYVSYCRALLEALADRIPAVRVPFGRFALMGEAGIGGLRQLLECAKSLGYYVLLDCPELMSPWAADDAAERIFGPESRYPCDGLILQPYIGSDALKPFLPYCAEGKKSVFAVVRSPNRSASEQQDLLTGSRHAYEAAAETVSRMGESLLAKCGYSQIGGVASCCAPDSLRLLRMKHNRVFLLVDGLDYPGGNAKICSYAFDRFGYGAAVCAGPCITGAWRESSPEDGDPLSCAVQAAEQVKKKLARYVTIL